MGTFCISSSIRLRPGKRLLGIQEERDVASEVEVQSPHRAADQGPVLREGDAALQSSEMKPDVFNRNVPVGGARRALHSRGGRITL